MESEEPALKESFSDGDTSGSTASSSTHSTSPTNSMKLKKKLKNRRSILNQIEDGKIRRKPQMSNQQQARRRERNVGTAARAKMLDEDRRDRSLETKPETKQTVMSTPPRSSFTINSRLSPSPIENLKHITEESARSISRKRERKEAAEQRLLGLFSAASLIRTKSEEGSYHYPSAMDARVDTMSDGSSRNTITKRKLFEQGQDQENDVCVDNNENIIHPIPKRVSETDANVIASKLVDIGKPEDDHVEDDGDVKVMHNISDQLNIQVHDNFYIFTL